jgi:hypothetical protein
MKHGLGILKHSIQNSKIHFYNSLLLTDDLAFQPTHFRKTATNIPRLYQRKRGLTPAKQINYPK